MSAGDIALDSSGNEVLDGAGNLMLKPSGDCAPCCDCDEYFQVTDCVSGSVYYICCNADTPEIGTILGSTSASATPMNCPYVEVDPDTLSFSVDCDHPIQYGGVCLKVTGECAALPDGGVIIGELGAGDATACSDRLCNPCPPVCTVVGLVLALDGINALSCVPPIHHAAFDFVYVTGLSAPSGSWYFPGRFVEMEEGSIRTALERSGACVSDPSTVYFGSNASVFFGVNCFQVLISVIVAPNNIGAGPGLTGEDPGWFYSVAVFDIPPGGLVDGASFVLSDNKPWVRFETPIGSGGTATVTVRCSLPTFHCYFTYNAVCTNSGYVVTLVNTECLGDPQDGKEHDWIDNGSGTFVKVVKGGTCTGVGDCTPGSPPSPPSDPPCQAYCYDTFKAVCSLGAWTVSYVSSTCSLTDLTREWFYVTGVLPSTQMKIVKQGTCTIGGTACVAGTAPSPPDDTPDCEAHCLYLWTSFYDCINAVWSTPLLIEEYCGVDTPYDWQINDCEFGDVTFAQARTLTQGAKCTGGGRCSSVGVSVPSVPVTTPTCPYCYVTWEEVLDCDSQVWNVSLVSVLCSCTDISTSGWVDDGVDGFGNHKRKQIVKKLHCNNNADCPPGDPPTASTDTDLCATFCTYTYTALFFCNTDQPGWNGPLVALASTTCGVSGAAHDWALTSCDGVALAVYTKIVVDLTKPCTKDADCSPPSGDLPDGPSSGPSSDPGTCGCS